MSGAVLTMIRFDPSSLGFRRAEVLAVYWAI